MSSSKLEQVFKAGFPLVLAGLIALIAFLLLDQTVRSQAPDDFVWVEQASGDFDEPASIATDSQNNIFITGGFQYTGTFGSGENSVVLVGDEQGDFYIAKYDSFGKLLWAKQVSGNFSTNPSDITVDQQGNAFITGIFEGTANFEETMLSSAGGWDIFFAKYDAVGTLQWVEQAGGSDNDSGRSIVADSEGNSLVAGAFTEVANFNTTIVTSTGNSDLFLAKYDPAGNLLWVEQIGGSGSDGVEGVAVDQENNSLVVGAFSGTATFSATVLTGTNGGDWFLAKYDPAGQLVLSQVTIDG